MCDELEIMALNNIFKSLEKLDTAQIKRILNWITSKFELNRYAINTEVSLGGEKSVGISTPQDRECTSTNQKYVNEDSWSTIHSIRSSGFESTPIINSRFISNLIKFNTIEELFFASNTRTITSKILLTAAYLQAKHSRGGISSDDICSNLNRVGITLKNPNDTINKLMNKTPSLVVQVDQSYLTPQEGKKIRVTEEGVRIALNYINES